MGSHRYRDHMYLNRYQPFCKPDDGQTGPKHVAHLTNCRLATANCMLYKDGSI